MTIGIPAWCSDIAASSTRDLHPSALSFVKRLDLPPKHPNCIEGYNLFPSTSLPAPQDDEYSIFSWEGFSSVGSIVQFVITIYYQVAPALLAMAELWLRLFAFIVTPVCICYFLSIEIKLLVHGSLMKKKCIEKYEILICFLGLASSSIILTDTLYVLELGRKYGAVLFSAMVLFSARSYRRAKTHLNSSQNIYFLLALSTIIWTVLCLISSHSHGQYLIGDTNIFRILANKELNVGHGSDTWANKKGYLIHDGTGLDLPTYNAGFYHSGSNALMNAIARNWSDYDRRYETENGGDATPWLITGDSRTGIPFLVNSVSSISAPFRLWVPSEVDEEANAIDIFFPEDGIHRTDKPIYLVLHGLNGGSNEEYIKEFTNRRCQDGSTVAVIIARGLMNTPVVGWNVFNGARISDVQTAAKALRRALAPNQALVGAGFSMGAIILANYVARSGSDCYLDAAVSVSGGLNMREQLTFFRSMRLWQPLLAQELRDTILGQFRKRYEYRLSETDYVEFMRSSHVSSIDRYAVVKYNEFEDLTHYYSEMSAMGEPGRIENVSVPLLVIHALDDPLITWRTMGSPEDVVSSGNGFVMMLLTKTGGHVGWPLGMNPAERGWEWMNDRVAGFVNSFDSVRQRQ